jgi:hypothetical protein
MSKSIWNPHLECGFRMRIQETKTMRMQIRNTGSPNRQTHLLQAFFNALVTNGLATNLEKSVFAVPSLEVLGQTI